MQVRPAASEAEAAAALDLRERVFCGEQGVSAAADRDGRDPEALHIVALDDGRIVGTCRVLFDEDLARLGRMAVEAPLRGHGIGRAVLDAAESEARARGAARMRLHAQTSAVALYERAGYSAVGDVFMEEGIPHLTMEKELA